MNNDHLMVGIRLVKLAIESDKNFNYEQATVLYDQSVSRLKLSLNCINFYLTYLMSIFNFY